jgi:anti-sigma factor RsiW
MQLMAYHDGELSEAEARAVELALEQEPALLQELESYRRLGSFVRAWDQSSTADLSSFDVSESVLAALEPPRARVHSLLPRIATWVSLGAAIAAGSVLVVRSWSAAPLAPPGSPSAEHAGYASPSASGPELSVPELSAVLKNAGEAVDEATGEVDPNLPPATIESVDFGSNAGEVFVVSTDSSETPVVWMPDDGEPDEDNEDRSESL